MVMSGQFHAVVTLPQRKSPLYPVDRRPGGPQSQSEHDGNEKNSQPLLGLKPPTIQPVSLIIL